MPPSDVAAAHTLPDLGRVVISWLEHADLCEVLRKRAQVVALRAELAMPRRATGDTSSRWLSGVHVVCELASRERFGARACFLALPADQAAGLLDRVLGGSGQLGVAAAPGALSDAECGVLAHLAAQLCTACSSALAVRDVFCAEAEKLRALCADGALWPLRLSASLAREPAPVARPAQREFEDDLAFDAKLLFGGAADCPAGRYALALTLPDAIAPEALAALEVGDLLTSDAWPLSLTARGLEGTVTLDVSGVSERASALLCGAHVTRTGERAGHVRSGAAGPEGGAAAPAELRLAELALDFWQLAELAAGGALELPDGGPRDATLYVAGQPRAAGCLVRLRGAIALRVHTLFSATRSDSAASSACPRASDPG